LHNCERFGQLQAVCATETLKISHRPDGKLTFCSFFAGRWCPCRGWHSVNRELPDLLQHSCLCARSSSKVPIAPMGKLLTCLPRLTLAQLRPTLRSTTVCTCRRYFKTSHRPHRRLTFARCLQGGGVYVAGGTVAISSCTISGNQALYSVRAHAQNFASPRWEPC
jgi:hypothetical protein